MFGGVPIRVTMPPRIEANEIGIRESAGLRFALRAAWMSSGIRRASAATLFIIVDNAAERVAMMPMCAARPREASSTRRASRSMAPVRDSPRLMIRTSAMITTAGWPNPVKICPFGTTPRTAASTKPPNATRRSGTSPR